MKREREEYKHTIPDLEIIDLDVIDLNNNELTTDTTPDREELYDEEDKPS